MDACLICNMTRMGRVYHRRILLYSGNKQGLVSYGIGKGMDYIGAYENAYAELGKNLIAINLDDNNTCPLPIRVRFNDYRIKLEPKQFPNVWGSPIMILMLRYAVLY